MLSKEIVERIKHIQLYTKRLLGVHMPAITLTGKKDLV